MILSHGSLQKGCKTLLCQQRIFWAASDLGASIELRYIYCPHILLSHIVYNIFLVLVHASVTVTKYNYLLGFLAINRIIS